ncbi:structural contituent of cuticle [Holotrichia oblita]|uniref:Structural contituent of cuticle n=1 Tax=Holotrichia oblita TaxID=644536 RepID=A0ACB9SJG7_HOLOL|nr:structural contituent of cuticle [Holotrichia oblita]
MFKLIAILPLLPLILCETPYITQSTIEPQEPPRPYAFGYAAGRYPGHIDRTHSEISNGDVVQGSYSYVDPKFQIRTVDYVADKNGFHPVLNFSPPPLPQDSLAVAAAKERHLAQYQAIANAHQSGQVIVPIQTPAFQKIATKHNDLYEEIAAEHARLAAEREAEKLHQDSSNLINHY